MDDSGNVRGSYIVDHLCKHVFRIWSQMLVVYMRDNRG
jgi:hypothetical protein